MTKIITTVTEWQNLAKPKSMGVVPTMGNLHAGHQSLLERSVEENDFTVLTIFVNPTQFDQPDDLAKYPKTFAQDVKLATAVGTDVIFAPNDQELYPDNYQYRIIESEFSRQLCGKHRPGHFDGVLTIVLKLLNLIQAQKAYFGEKDFQQLELIRGLCKAFFINTEIIACPIIRDSNGLALSSRNSRLTSEQYLQALDFPKLLQKNMSAIEIVKQLTTLGFQVDYIEEHQGRRYGAVRIGDVRLIDNINLTGN